MAEALEAGYDLGAIMLCLLALGLLYAAKGLVAGVAKVFDKSIFGYRPFHFIAVDLENAVVSALDDAIKGVERATAKFASGLIDALGLLIAIPLLLGLGVKAALEYLWNAALRPVIHSIVDPVRTIASKAQRTVDDLADTVAANVGRAEDFARARAGEALRSAKAYVESRLEAAAGELRRDIAAALSTAERYADEAVSKLRAAEDAAVANAVHLASAALAAGEAAAAAALRTAEGEIVAAEREAEAAAASALAASDALGKAALEAVRSIAVTAEDELRVIEGAVGAAGTAALVAAIPALATLVRAIATEAGLENAECRGKVKGICGTNPKAWEGFLAGLTAFGLAFSLEQLYEVARPLVDELAGVISEAA